MASTTKFAFTTAPLRMSLSPGKVSMQPTQIMIQTKPSVFKPNEKKKFPLTVTVGVVVCVLFRDSAEHLKGNLHVSGLQQVTLLLGPTFVCPIPPGETIQPR